MTNLLPRRAARLVVSLGLLPVLQACGGEEGTGPVIEPRVAAETSTAPEFATVSVGGTTQLAAAARDSAGVLIPNPSVAWASLPAAGVATVSGTGVDGTVGGVAPGVARISARVNDASDTSWVAVLGPSSLLATAFVGARPSATVSRGQTVTVPVRLDMSRVGASGDLGSARIDLLYNPGVLVYQSAVAGVAGSSSFSVPSPGTFRYAFDGAAPQGSANLTLVSVTFQVAPSAPLDSYIVLVLNHTSAPASTGGQPYDPPVSVWGRVRVTQ